LFSVKELIELYKIISFDEILNETDSDSDSNTEHHKMSDSINELRQTNEIKVYNSIITMVQQA